MLNCIHAFSKHSLVSYFIVISQNFLTFPSMLCFFLLLLSYLSFSFILITSWNFYNSCPHSYFRFCFSGGPWVQILQDWFLALHLSSSLLDTVHKYVRILFYVVLVSSILCYCFFSVSLGRTILVSFRASVFFSLHRFSSVTLCLFQLWPSPYPQGVILCSPKFPPHFASFSACYAFCSDSWVCPFPACSAFYFFFKNFLFLLRPLLFKKPSRMSLPLRCGILLCCPFSAFYNPPTAFPFLTVLL